MESETTLKNNNQYFVSFTFRYELEQKLKSSLYYLKGLKNEEG
jgi:hypothetical protein